MKNMASTMKNCGNIPKKCASIFSVGVWYACTQKSAHPFRKTADPLKNQKRSFFLSNCFQFGSGSPDPFDVFGIDPNELPDIPDEPPLPVIPPPKKRLSLKVSPKEWPKENNQVHQGHL